MAEGGVSQNCVHTRSIFQRGSKITKNPAALSGAQQVPGTAFIIVTVLAFSSIQGLLKNEDLRVPTPQEFLKRCDLNTPGCVLARLHSSKPAVCRCAVSPAVVASANTSRRDTTLARAGD